MLDAYTSVGIILRAVHISDELTALVCVERKYLQSIYKISEKHSADIAVLRQTGLYWSIKAIVRRPILICGILIMLALSLIVPKTVILVEVEGNSQIPQKQILDAAAAAGIRFGARKSQIRSEKVKNTLLEMLPQLQWVGITTDGCVATVSVKERSVPEAFGTPRQICGIYAAKDGVIQSMQVTKGTALCKVGQAVRKGELLISGYTDCGLTLRATGAEGEIYAQTLQEIKTVLPAASLHQGEKTGEILRWSIIIGKKRINFYKDSGICDTSCDKMYKEYYMTLPGGIQLPLAIAAEQLTFYDSSSACAAADASEELTQWSEDYLLQGMVAGQILSANISAQHNPSLSSLTGTYYCLEMIGRLHQEEITGIYGKTD